MRGLDRKRPPVPAFAGFRTFLKLFGKGEKTPMSSRKPRSSPQAPNNPYASLIGSHEQRRADLLARQEQVREMQRTFRAEQKRLATEQRKMLQAHTKALRSTVRSMRNVFQAANDDRRYDADVRAGMWQQVAKTLMELRRRQKGYIDLRSQIPRGRIT